MQGKIIRCTKVTKLSPIVHMLQINVKGQLGEKFIGLENHVGKFVNFGVFYYRLRFDTDAS